MAANETVNNDQTNVETIVNRWVVDYYGFLAIEFFKNDQHKDFCSVRDVLEKILDRPVEHTDAMRTKIQVLKFLSRINEGEKLELSFDCDQSITPLESVLMMLENWQKTVHSQDFENVRTSVKEMIVRILIKNREFDKAREVLNKHFPRPMVGKKAIFMALVRQKNTTHKFIEQIDFHQFKMDMLAFCMKLCTFDAPFLCKAAKQLIDRRHTEQDNREADEQDKSGSSSSPQMNNVQVVPGKNIIISKTRLKLAFKVIAPVSYEKSFAQLEEEVESEEQAKEHCYPCLSHTPKKGTNQDCVMEKGLFQRDSGSPMEASPADQPPQTNAVPQTQAGTLSKSPSELRSKQPYSVAQLVMGPDSQSSSQCTTASQELETEVRTEEPAQSLPASTEKDLQCPITDSEVTIPTRILPRRANKTCSRASTSLADLSKDDEEDLPTCMANGDICVGKLHNTFNSPLIRTPKSKESLSDSEEDPQESCSFSKIPVRTPCTRSASNSLKKGPSNTDDICITDSSLDSSPNQLPIDPVPQTSSTPQKVSTQDKGSSLSKWRHLFNEAKETKETWSDEESCVNSRNSRGFNETTMSNSGQRKRMWTDSETQMLKEGVKKFGEGNWSKIKAYYSFNDRTNVNLKDRWRTMKKLKMV